MVSVVCGCICSHFRVRKEVSKQQRTQSNTAMLKSTVIKLEWGGQWWVVLQLSASVWLTVLLALTLFPVWKQGTLSRSEWDATSKFNYINLFNLEWRNWLYKDTKYLLYIVLFSAGIYLVFVFQKMSWYLKSSSHHSLPHLFLTLSVQFIFLFCFLDIFLF